MTRVIGDESVWAVERSPILQVFFGIHVVFNEYPGQMVVTGNQYSCEQEKNHDTAIREVHEFLIRLSLYL